MPSAATSHLPPGGVHSIIRSWCITGNRTKHACTPTSQHKAPSRCCQVRLGRARTQIPAQPEGGRAGGCAKRGQAARWAQQRAVDGQLVPPGGQQPRQVPLARQRQRRALVPVQCVQVGQRVVQAPAKCTCGPCVPPPESQTCLCIGPSCCAGPRPAHPQTRSAPPQICSGRHRILAFELKCHQSGPSCDPGTLSTATKT